MPSNWVSQSIYGTTTDRVLERIRYLRGTLETCLTEAIMAYLSSKEPLETRTQVTLACFQAIGHPRFTSMLRIHSRSENALKQDIGLFVPVLLVSIFGAENVETYRNTDTNKASTRSNTWRDIQWVSRYTPHKVLRMSKKKK